MHLTNRPFAAGCAAVLVATFAHAQTMTVNTLDDVIDFPAPQTVAQLPGPDGRISFHEAIFAANNTPGAQTIEFAIPVSEFWLLPNIGLLRLEGPFVLTDDATTIDFSSQERNVGDTNPNGPDVGIYGLQPNGWGSPAIIVMASNCEIRGLGPVYQRGSSVSIWQGASNRIVGCQTGTIEIDGSFGGPVTHSNIVGGTAPGDANDLTTVEILCWSDNNVVIGNRIRHVRVEGSQYCVYPTGNRIGGPTPEERNVIAGWGSYGEEGFPNGSMVQVTWASGTLVEGNYIGTTPDGMAREPQIGTAGVSVTDSIETTIRGNLIAGLRTAGANHYAGQLFGQAIAVGATNANNQSILIEDNLIGLAADGVTPIPTLNGVFVAPATALRRIFDTLIVGNEIGAVERYGVLVHSLISEVTISANSIHDSGMIGIELARFSGADGPTPNDPLDADTDGGNGLQNYPVLSAATASAISTRIVGTLGSAANRTFRVEFFASPSCDPSGFGEGRDYLGATDVTTDASGTASIDVSVPVSVIVGASVTATATEVTTGNTSEFSACVTAAAGGGTPGDVDGDGHVTLSDLAALLTAFGSCSGDATFNASADFDSNGCVELADLAVLLTYFGE